MMAETKRKPWREWTYEKQKSPQGDWVSLKAESTRGAYLYELKELAAGRGSASLEGLLSDIATEWETGKITRKWFDEKVHSTTAQVAASPEMSYLMMPLVELAVRKNWMNRLIRKSNKVLREEGGKGWDNKRWMNLWMDGAMWASCEENGSSGFGKNRLWRWIRMGRFDHRIDDLLLASECHPEDSDFAKLVATRCTYASEWN